jgi:hypothetical protein
VIGNAKTGKLGAKLTRIHLLGPFISLEQADNLHRQILLRTIKTRLKNSKRDINDSLAVAIAYWNYMKR